MHQMHHSYITTTYTFPNPTQMRRAVMQTTANTPGEHRKLDTLHQSLVRLKYLAVARADHDLLADTESLSVQVRGLITEGEGGDG